MTCKDCIHSGLCYKENDYDNFPDICGSFIPERQQGEWVEGKWQTAMECNYCGCPCHQYVKNFCANCGADMRGEKK